VTDLDTLLRFAQADLWVLLEALLAIVLGGAVGWEREAAGKNAGLRTNILVCLAAFLFVRIAGFLVVNVQDVTQALNLGVEGGLRYDPIRIVEAVVTGISFLGAGVVFRDRDEHRTRGLTTAATLLLIAPIGMAVAVRHYLLAIGATLLGFVILRLLDHLEPDASDA
jgi:putative Mg2+ transporter-C (MgtC) family protein